MRIHENNFNQILTQLPIINVIILGTVLKFIENAFSRYGQSKLLFFGESAIKRILKEFPEKKKKFINFLAFLQNFLIRKNDFLIRKTSLENSAQKTCSTCREQDSWWNFCIELSTLESVYSSAQFRTKPLDRRWNKCLVSSRFLSSLSTSGLGGSKSGPPRVISHVHRKLLCYLLRFFQLTILKKLLLKIAG